MQFSLALFKLIWYNLGIEEEEGQTHLIYKENDMTESNELRKIAAQKGGSQMNNQAQITWSEFNPLLIVVLDLAADVATIKKRLETPSCVNAPMTEGEVPDKPIEEEIKDATNTDSSLEDSEVAPVGEEEDGGGYESVSEQEESEGSPVAGREDI